MNMSEWKELLSDKSTDFIRRRLEHTIEEIDFLQSIYETGGANNFYSTTFRDAAHRERQELCQLSSALYSILRDRGEEI